MKPMARGLLGLLAALLLAGCGSGRVKPHGRLLNNGAPYVPGERDSVHIALFPVAEGGAPPEGACEALFNREDGTFQALGADGKGVLPGKYRICIQVIRRKKDVLKGAFGATKSPFVREVSNGSADFTLDLAKPRE
jgi:hypothetical protein